MTRHGLRNGPGLTGAADPNVLLLRGAGDSADERVAAILDVLLHIEYELSQGAVVIIEEAHCRIRYLPSGDA